MSTLRFREPKSLAKVTYLESGEPHWTGISTARDKVPEGQKLRLCLGRHSCSREVGVPVGKSWHKGVVKGQGLRSLRTGWFPSVRAVTFGMLPNFRDPRFFFHLYNVCE